MKLLAYTAEDRYAFVRDGDKVLAMHPPFAPEKDEVVSEGEVGYAVTIAGFQACDRDFATREELIKFLEEESVKSWRARGGGEKSLAELREGLLALRRGG